MAQHRIGIALQAVLVCLVIIAGAEQKTNLIAGFPSGTFLFRSLCVFSFFLMLMLMAGAGNRSRNRCYMLTGSGILVVLPLIYAWNASHNWGDAVGLIPVTYRSWLPASAYPIGTFSTAWILLGAIAIMGSMVLVSDQERRRMRYLWILMAALVAVWAICQRAIPRRYPVYEWSGWFVSPNHFVALACLVLPVSCTMGWCLQRRDFKQGKLSSPAFLLYVAAGLLAYAALLTGSRAGTAILLLQLLLVAVVIGGRRLYSRMNLRYLAVLVLLMMTLTVLAVQRGGLLRVAEDLRFRGQIAQDTLAVWRASPWWGTGPGTFAAVFPYYQSENLSRHFFSHAHNDPVQMLAEWGILGVTALVLGVWLLLCLGRSDLLRNKQEGMARIEKSGLMIGLLGVCMHSLVDFPFRHPQVLLLACAWLGMLIPVLRENPE